MKFQDLKLSVTYVQRSTRSTWLFQELEHSKTDLNDATEVKSCNSGLGKLIQMLYNAWMNEWMKIWVLNMHDLAGIFNCHWWTHASTVPKAARKWMDLASILFNYACEWWFNQEPDNGFGEICRKSERKSLWKKCKNGSRSEILMC